jgi:integrase-like protein
LDGEGEAGNAMKFCTRCGSRTTDREICHVCGAIAYRAASPSPVAEYPPAGDLPTFTFTYSIAFLGLIERERNVRVLFSYTGAGRKAGTWVVDFYDAAGVRHRYFRATKKEAPELEDQLRVEKWRQQREGLPLPELRDVTVAEYGERWLRDSASRLKAHSVRSYTGLFRSRIAPVFGQMKVAQLHRSHVKRLLVEKYELGLSKDTIRLIRATISAMYAAAIDDGVAIVNPATLPRRAKALGRSPKIDIRPLSESELAALLSTAEREDWPFTLSFCCWRGPASGSEKLGRSNGRTSILGVES